MSKTVLLGDYANASHKVDTIIHFGGINLANVMCKIIQNHDRSICLSNRMGYTYNM